MTQHNVQFSTAIGATPSQNPYSTPLAVPHNAEIEDPEDWEYEYSTTETETYYVTLDLSTPQDPKPLDESKYEKPKKNEENEAEEGVSKRLSVIPSLNKIWVNEGLKQGSRNAGKMRGHKNHKRKPANKKGVGKLGEQKDGIDSDENDMESEDDEDPIVNATDKGLKKKGNNPSAKSKTPAAIPDSVGEGTEKPTKVQILDLHHKHPIVSYGGQIFTCKWAQNIGTEFLFTEHDGRSPLPALRNLRDGVDLVAMSSIRIVSKHVELEQKHNAQPISKSTSGGGWASETVSTEREKKLEQKDFLSQLNEIKRDRGEEDGVTIITKKQRSEKEWREEWTKKRNQEKARLKRVIKAKKDLGTVEEAEMRLKVLDEEDARRKARAREMPSKRALNAGRKKKLRPDAPTTSTPTTRSRTPNTRGSAEGVLQTPDVDIQTGQTWGGDDANEMDDEEIMEDDLYDEDAPFEDDDTRMDDAWE